MNEIDGRSVISKSEVSTRGRPAVVMLCVCVCVCVCVLCCVVVLTSDGGGDVVLVGGNDVVWWGWALVNGCLRRRPTAAAKIGSP